jgi:hypothetical protein
MTMFSLTPLLEPLFDIAFGTNGQRCRPGRPGRRSVERLMADKAERDRQAWLARQAEHPSERARV